MTPTQCLFAISAILSAVDRRTHRQKRGGRSTVFYPFTIAEEINDRELQHIYRLAKGNTKKTRRLRP